MSQDFEVTTVHQDGIVTLSCRGELDVLTTGDLRRAIDRALAHGSQHLHIDATGITLLSSVGVEVLLEAAARCHDDVSEEEDRR